MCTRYFFIYTRVIDTTAQASQINCNVSIAIGNFLKLIAKKVDWMKFWIVGQMVNFEKKSILEKNVV